jgi:hypothetical protein
MKTRVRKPWPSILLGLALAGLLPLPGFAQNARLHLNNLEKLNSKAAEVNDVTLDGDMLKLAGKFLEVDKDPEAAQVKDMLKDLKGIYIKNFEFDQPNQYSPADVEEVRSQLAAPGWSKIVENHNKRGHETNEIYVMRDGDKVSGVVILVAEPKELTVVNIVGFIDLDKLSELEGKFGIPEEKQQPKKSSPEAPNEDH